MAEEPNEVIGDIENTAKRRANFTSKTLLKPIIIVFSIPLLIALFWYAGLASDATYNDDDITNAPSAIRRYTDGISVSTDGNSIVTSKTIREYWKELVENENRITAFIHSPEELATIINAITVTKYPDLRANPEEEINWTEINKDVDSTEIQGIVKFKRALADDELDLFNESEMIDGEENKIYMTYVSPEELQEYITEYNTSGSSNAKKNALSHFTLSSSVSFSSTQVTSNQPPQNTEETETNPTPNNPDEIEDNENNEETGKLIGNGAITGNMETKFVVKVAKWSENTDIKEKYINNAQSPESSSSKSYMMQLQPVEYQNYIKGYHIPFEYLWSLLLISDDTDFIIDLANLVYNSKLEITVHDSVTTNTNIYTYAYNHEKRADIQAAIRQETSEGEFIDLRTFYQNDAWLSSTNYKEIEKTIKKENTLNIAVTLADVWCVKYSREYTYNGQAEENSSDTGQISLEDNVTIGDWESLSGLAYIYVRNHIGQYERVVSGNARYKTYEKDRKEQTEDYIVRSDYTAEPPDITEKTEKYESISEKENDTYDNDDGKPNFVTVLISNGKAKSNILSSDETLFTLLELNEDTIEMIDLTKYLLYKATEQNYGVTEFDFNIFDPNYFRQVAGGRYIGDSFEAKVWFALIDAGYTKEAAAGAMGNLYRESNFKSNNLEGTFENILGYTDETYTVAVDDGSYPLERFISDHTSENCGAGYGLAQWTYCTRKEGLYKYAKSKNVSIADEDMQIEYLLTELSLTGGPASPYASSIFESETTKGYWANASTPEEAAKYFNMYFEGGTGTTERQTAARDMYNKWKDYDAGGVESAGASGEITRFTSGITGRTFKVFRQYGDKCNRAAQSIMCSGYDDSITGDNWDNVGSLAPHNTYYYDRANLKESKQTIDNDNSSNNYQFPVDKIRTQLLSGGYLIMYLRGNGAPLYSSGRSQYQAENYPDKRWAHSMHWVCILGYRNINGIEEIYISDSGNGNTGWHPIDELNHEAGKSIGLIDAVYFINEKN